jgi:hypothetical protein
VKNDRISKISQNGEWGERISESNINFYFLGVHQNITRTLHAFSKVFELKKYEHHPSSFFQLTLLQVTESAFANASNNMGCSKLG